MNPYCIKCHARLNDGHDCDNCSYCGTDGARNEPPERDPELEQEKADSIRDSLREDGIRG